MVGMRERARETDLSKLNCCVLTSELIYPFLSIKYINILIYVSTYIYSIFNFIPLIECSESNLFRAHLYEWELLPVAQGLSCVTNVTRNHLYSQHWQYRTTQAADYTNTLTHSHIVALFFSFALPGWGLFQSFLALSFASVPPLPFQKSDREDVHRSIAITYCLASRNYCKF